MFNWFLDLFTESVSYSLDIDQDNVSQAKEYAKEYIRERKSKFDYFVLDGTHWSQFKKEQSLRNFPKMRSKLVRFVEFVTFRSGEWGEGGVKTTHEKFSPILLNETAKVTISSSSLKSAEINTIGLEDGDEAIVVRAFGKDENDVIQDCLMVLPLISVHFNKGDKTDPIHDGCKAKDVCLIPGLRALDIFLRDAEPDVEKVYEDCMKIACRDIDYADMAECDGCLESPLEERNYIFQQALKEITSVTEISYFSLHCPGGNERLHKCKNVLLRVIPDKNTKDELEKFGGEQQDVFSKQTQNDIYMPTFQIVVLFSESLIQNAWLFNANNDILYSEDLYDTTILSDYFHKNAKYTDVRRQLMNKQMLCEGRTFNEVIFRQILQRLVVDRGYTYSQFTPEPMHTYLTKSIENGDMHLDPITKLSNRL